jgi:origin recognition complex subunit 4
MEIIKPVDNISKCPKEFRMVKLLIEPTQIHEAVMKTTTLPYEVKRWSS